MIDDVEKLNNVDLNSPMRQSSSKNVKIGTYSYFHFVFRILIQIFTHFLISIELAFII